MRKGFTLVELSLSIVFIAVLSIIIMLLINNAIVSYRRGLILNQLNTVGMDLVDDVRSVVQASPSGTVVGLCNGLEEGKDDCVVDGGSKFVSVTVKGKVGEMENVPLYGAFCTGLYSYVWNSGYFFGEEASNIRVGESSVSAITNGSDSFRLVKVRDKKRAVCRNAVTDKYEIGTFSLQEYDNEGRLVPMEIEEDVLASDNNNNLAIYDFSAPVPATNSDASASFYSVSFILGTIQGGINVVVSGNFCKAPTETNENFNYCAINKFNFAAQAIGS